MKRNIAALFALLTSVIALERCRDPAVFSNEASFAIINNDGSVTAWGNQLQGGDPTSANITKPIASIVSSSNAFTALSADRLTLFSWGMGFGDQPTLTFSTPVREIVSNANAFAVLLEDGTVRTFGESYSGGNSSSVQAELMNVEKIFSSCCSFLALRSNGTVVVWGQEFSGGKLPEGFVNENVESVHSSDNIFVVEKSDGTFSCFGSIFAGKDCDSFNATAPFSHFAFNAMAYAAIDADGLLHTWGLEDLGGDSSGVNLTGRPVQLVSNSFTFTILMEDGNAVTWGPPMFDGKNVMAITGANCTKVFSNGVGSACLTGNGTVENWGSSSFDGFVPGENETVVDIFTNENAFAALTLDGKVFAWGNDNNGGSLDEVNIDKPIGYIASTGSAFVAVALDGSLFAWGDFEKGGNYAGFSHLTKVQSVSNSIASSAVLMENGNVVVIGRSIAEGGVEARDIKAVAAIGTTYSAINKNDTVVSIGTWTNGFDTLNLTGGFSQIYSNLNAFVAVKFDGSLVSFGSSTHGGAYRDGIAFDSKVKSVVSSRGAFAVHLEDQSVVCFGHKNYGGDCSGESEQLKNVEAVYSNTFCFVAVTPSGVLPWGDDRYGGNIGDLNFTGGVVTIVSSDRAFAAIKAIDQSVVAWGHSDYGGNLPQSLIGVKELIAAPKAFAVMLGDGGVFSWGHRLYGGDSTSVSIEGDVVDFRSWYGGFYLLYSDQRATSWGAISQNFTNFVDISASTTGESILVLTPDNVVTWFGWAGSYKYPPKSSAKRTALFGAHEGSFIVQSDDGTWEVIGSTSTVKQNEVSLSCTPNPTVTPTNTPSHSPTVLPTGSAQLGNEIEDDKSSVGLLVGTIVPAVLVLIAGAGLFFWRRKTLAKPVSNEIQSQKV